MILRCAQVIDYPQERVRVATFTALDGSDASMTIRYTLPSEHDRPLVGLDYDFTVRPLNSTGGRE